MIKMLTKWFNVPLNHIFEKYIFLSFKKAYLKDDAAMSYRPTLNKVELVASSKATTFTSIFEKVWCGGNKDLKEEYYSLWGLKIVTYQSAIKLLNLLLSVTLIYNTYLTFFQNFSATLLWITITLSILNSYLYFSKERKFRPTLNYGPENLIAIHNMGKATFLAKNFNKVFVTGHPEYKIDEYLASSQLKPLEIEIFKTLYLDGYPGCIDDLLATTKLLAN